MSRSPTRTPPIHINPMFFSSLSSLDDTAIACIMRISAYHVDAGRPLTVAEFGRGAGQDGLFLHALLQGVSHMLDPVALAAGDLVVVHVAEGIEHRAEIMAKRSEAANKRYVRAAAEQKAQGAEIKLTRGRVAGRGKVAAAGGSVDAYDPSVCTHVHNEADYAHVCTEDVCTHVHNSDLDAHVCIPSDGTHVHKTALDAHMCINDGSEQVDDYAHVCIPSAHDDPETAENVGFRSLDRSDEPSHVRVRPPRADLSISNHSSEKNKRVESVRGRGRYDEVETVGGRFPGARGNLQGVHAPRTPVATINHNPGGYDSSHDRTTSNTVSGYRPSAGSPPSGTPVPAEFVRRLLDAGPVDGDNARKKLAEWIDRWGEPFVRSGVEAIPNKEIARPLSYLSSILTNLAKEAGDVRPASRKATGTAQEPAEAQSGLRMPRRVKRRISMPPGAAWEHLGWTAKGHEGDVGKTRRQVWRTESGDLRYMDAPASDNIPSYEEDPGVYAYD